MCVVDVDVDGGLEDGEPLGDGELDPDVDPLPAVAPLLEWPGSVSPVEWPGNRSLRASFNEFP